MGTPLLRRGLMTQPISTGGSLPNEFGFYSDDNEVWKLEMETSLLNPT